MASAAWATVVWPKMIVVWKGGNRAPVSMRSKLVGAVALTGLCCAAFRIYPMVGGVAFAAGVSYLMFQSTRDRAAYDRIRGVGPVRPVPITAGQRWLGLCVVDVVVLLSSLIAFLRDLYFPPMTEEQRIVHMMGLGFLAISAAGAIALVMTRPRKA